MTVVRICIGTSCYLKGAYNVLQLFQHEIEKRKLHDKIEISGSFLSLIHIWKRITVIGRSLVIGKPVSMMLQARHATVTMCHTKTADIAAACRNAEILIAAAGKAGVVGADYTLSLIHI